VTAPRAARTDSTGTRVYPVAGPDGLLVELPSASTIINAMAKPALEGWKAKRMAEYAVTSEFSDLVSQSPVRAMDALKSAPYTDTGRSDLGTDVHAVCEADDLGVPFELPPRTGNTSDAERLEAVEPFLWQWQDLKARMGVVIVDVERTTYNLTARMAGTCDRLCIVPPLVDQGHQRQLLPVIGDIKTGARVYPEVALQLACYAHAEGIIGDDGTQLPPWPQIDRTVGVVFGLHADHWDIIPVDLVAAWDAMRGLARLAHFQREESRGVIGRPLRIPPPSRVTPAAIPSGAGSAVGSTSGSPPPDVPAANVTRDRLRARITGLTDDARQILKDSWPSGTPVLTRPGISVAQVHDLDRLVATLEQRDDAPRDAPTTETPAEAPPVDPADILPLTERLVALPPDLRHHIDTLAVAAGVPHTSRPNNWTADHLTAVDGLLVDAEDTAGRRLRALQAAASEAGLTADERHALAHTVAAGRTTTTKQLDQAEADLFRALARRIANTDLGIVVLDDGGALLAPPAPIDLPAHMRARKVPQAAVTRQAQTYADQHHLPKPKKAADIPTALYPLLLAWLDLQPAPAKAGT